MYSTLGVSHENFTGQLALVRIGFLRSRSEDSVGGDEVAPLDLLLNRQVVVVDDEEGQCAHEGVAGARRVHRLDLLRHGNVQRLVAIHEHGPVGAHGENDRAAALVEDHLAGDAAVVDAVHAQLRHQVCLRLVDAQNVAQRVDVTVLHWLRKGRSAVH